MNIDLKVAAAYIRVSTDNQTELSPDSQLKIVREYAKQHGFIIPNEYVLTALVLLSKPTNLSNSTIRWSILPMLQFEYIEKS